MAFAHLHNRTQYSLLDGAMSPDELAKRASDLGQPAVAVTDTCNLYGGLELYKAAKYADVHAVYGAEMWLWPEGLATLSPTRPDDGWHIVLLIEDKAGYHNLCKLVTTAIFDGMHYRPRIDLDLLRKHKDGLIALTSGLNGPVGRLLPRPGGEDQARETLARLAEIFGPEHLFVELQDFGIPRQVDVNDASRRLAASLGLPTVVTNDCRYLQPTDAITLDLLNCIARGTLVDDPERVGLPTDQQYVKSEAEMRDIFPDDAAAIERTVVIAERCHFTYKMAPPYFFPATNPPDPDPPDTRSDPRSAEPRPRADTQANWEYFYKAFPPPRDFGMPDPEKQPVPARVMGAGSINGYFGWYSREGLKRRLAMDVHPDQHQTYWDQLEYELRVIEQMGFPAYLLIVAEFINWSKDHGIPVGPGRGSAAGSVVAWAMRITDIDPMRFTLIFERFLNPERVSMPDIDVDFCQDRREESIQHVRKKYGEDLVSQIITYGKLQAKAALKDIARVLGIEFQSADYIAKLVPNVLNIKLKEALLDERFAALAAGDPLVGRVSKLALRIEGMTRQTGVHAAGVVIADRPLVEHAPLYRLGADGGPVVQYDMKSSEMIGLIKFDFLGLKTLDQIRDALILIERNTGEKIDLARIDLADERTYKLLQKGDGLGVFQVESSGMRELLTRLLPSNIEDLIALLALYRPGPLSSGMVDNFIDCKHGRKAITYPHPDLAPILQSTYGSIVYQEQVMQIAREMAGYTLGGADELRRAMGKKKKEEMDKQKSIFVSGAVQKGYDAALADQVFELLAYFAGYGFNKCVVGSTAIANTSTGERLTVKELYDAPRSITVLALGEDGRLRPRAVEGVDFNGLKPVFELKTDLGHRITATGNHPFRTLDGWKNLEDLSVGDRIAVPRRTPSVSTATWNKHELIALGWLLSEGNTCHPTCLYFYNNDSAAVEDFVVAIERFPETAARVYTRDEQRIEVCVSTGHDHRFTPDVSSNLALQALPARSGAYLWAQSLGLLGRKAHEKAIPAPIFSLHDEDIALLLGRLWTGDGFLSNHQLLPPYYATSSRQLAQDVQQLLLRLGILGRLEEKRFRYRGGVRLGYVVRVLGAESRASFVRLIVPHVVGRQEQISWLRLLGQSDFKDTIPAGIRRWVDEARRDCGLTWRELEARSGICNRELQSSANLKKKGFRRETIRQLGEFLQSERLLDAASSDVYWDTIAAIEPRGVQPTYDLTVAEDHNFVADGIVVHNSHSAAYGMISYQTAWLKAHHRAEFMAALMTIEAGNTDKVLAYIGDCRRAGIKVLPPDANESQAGFDVPKNDRRVIRFGLTGIKGVGDNAVAAIIDARKDAGGRFSGFMDCLERLDYKRVNKKVLENLIKCGAFDWTGHNRRAMMEGLTAAISTAQSIQDDKNAGQTSLFGLIPAAAAPPRLHLPDVGEWHKAQKLGFEREALGMFITGHPLEAFQDVVPRATTCPIAALERESVDSNVTVAGMISALRVIKTKRGSKMAFVTIEDTSGAVECVFFADPYLHAQRNLSSEQPLLVRGKLEKKPEGCKILAENTELLVDVRERRTSRVQLSLELEELSRDRIQLLHALLKGSLPQSEKGGCTVQLLVNLPGQGRATLALQHKVVPDDALLQGLETLFRRPDVPRLS